VGPVETNLADSNQAATGEMILFFGKGDLLTSMKHNRLLLNLLVAGMLLGGMILSTAPALALETVYPGSSGQSLEGSYSWNNSRPDGQGWGGIFGGENPAGETAALSKPKPPKSKSNGWGGIFGEDDPAGQAAALSRPRPPGIKLTGNGWGGTFSGEGFSNFNPPVYQGMLKVY
jgi:hypothetical protein